VDGRSSDRTRTIVAGLACEDERIVLLDNPGRFPSSAMNRGIARARGEVIVRMDAHAEYAADHVATCVRVLRETRATAVGGGAFPVGSSYCQRAVRVALWSFLGMGGSAYRDPTREGFVESVWNESFRREAFETVGLFDPEQRANEDAEMNQRILEAGGAIYLSRDLLVRYHPRSSLRSLFAQYFGYGQGRARTLLRRGRLLSLRPAVPALALVAFAASVVAALAIPGWAAVPAWLVAGYVLSLIAGSLLAGARARDLDVVPLVPAVLVTMHAGHALGLISGLVRFARHGLRHAPLPTLGVVRSRA
jgi:GT2 family glycosyltransferase